MNEQGSPSVLINLPNSEIGKKLKDANMEGYLFTNKISRAKLKKHGKKKVIIFLYRLDYNLYCLI